MRIGPVEINMAARNGKKPDTSEKGNTGTEIFSGNLSPVQDYNPLLNPPQSYDVFDKMRLGDGTVAAALRVIKLPLLNADWKVEPGTDAQEDKDIAERLETNLKRGMNVSFHALLRQILLHLEYGNAPFEKVWRVVDGVVELRKLAFRHPKTITQWLTDDKGGFAGIVQTTSPDFRAVEIDVSKLIVFINDLEGSNFTGVSILRPAYKHWYYVDGLERVQAIAAEKRSMGVDVVTLKGENRTEEKRQDAERAAMTMHAHEKMYYAEVDEQNSYRVQGIEGDVLDPLPAIERHDLRIVRSMITEFLAMGAGSTGSLAMHKDKSSFAMMALGGIANNICQTVDMHLLRPWVDYNWAVKEYPHLTYTHLDARPLAEFADAIEKLSAAKVLTRTLDVENAARSMLDLNPLPEAEFEEEIEPETPEELPTEQIAARIRADRAELRRRRETVAA